MFPTAVEVFISERPTSGGRRLAPKLGLVGAPSVTHVNGCMPSSRNSEPVRRPFRATLYAAMLAVGCGGRTGGGGGASGSGSASAGAGSASGGSGGTSGVLSGAGSVRGGAGVSADSDSESGCGVSGASTGMSGCCDPAEVNGGTRCPFCSNGMPKCNGDCVDDETDPDNCGGCGTTCPASAPSCHFGNCVPIVDAGTDGMGEPETGVPEAATDAGPPPSCAPGGPGMTNCGPGGSGTESCCTSLEVSGGTYYRTYTSDADGGALGLDDPATVSSFRLDKYDVTVGRFGQFANAVFPADGGAGWLPVAGSGKHSHLNGGLGLATGTDVDAGQTYESGWTATDDSFMEPSASPTCSPTWTAAVASQDNLPMSCVNWYEAYAFCIWDGGFLPSEAEWEYAAAGGSQQREYPWGATDPGTANQYAIYACNYPVGPPLCQDGGNIALVGTAMLGAARWGQLDMAGEVYEWTLDVQSTYVDPSADCANLTASAPSPARVIRGGSANSSKSFLLASSRGNDDSVDRQSVVGFRCARSP